MSLISRHMLLTWRYRSWYLPNLTPFVLPANLFSFHHAIKQQQIQLIITQQVSKVFGQNGGLESVRTQLLWAIFIERRQRFNVLLLKTIYRAFCVECSFLVFVIFVRYTFWVYKSWFKEKSIVIVNNFVCFYSPSFSY